MWDPQLLNYKHLPPRGEIWFGKRVDLVFGIDQFLWTSFSIHRLYGVVLFACDVQNVVVAEADYYYIMFYRLTPHMQGQSFSLSHTNYYFLVIILFCILIIFSRYF